MTKANITQYSSTPSSNSDINDINIAENCPASNINNAIRELMAHLKNVDTGSQALTALSVTGNVTVAGNIQKTSGDLTVDVAGDIILDADDGDVKINDNGSARMHIITSASETAFFNQAQDADIVFKGDDGGSSIEPMRIDMSNEGAVKIQNSSGGSALTLHRDFSGSNVSSDTTSATLDFTLSDSATSNQSIAKISPQATAGTGDAFGGKLRFFTADDGGSITQTMVITEDGNVGIGTTAPVAILNARRNSGTIAYFQNNAGTGAKIEGGDNSFSSVSDENKKENIVELNKQQSYDNIKNIRAVTYNFRDVVETNEDGTTTTYEDDKSRVGFIAQDWETNYSQLVNTDDDGVKSLLYTETTPVLLSALQKAQEKIEALEARITALENA